MKKFIKVFFTIFFVIVLLIVIDLHMFRGYFSDLYLTPFYNEDMNTEEVESNDLQLNIFKKDDRYHICFKNKTAKPFFVWTYRNDEILFKVNDSVFRYHYRLIPDIPEFKDKFDYGLDCGTGAGSFSINPYESFSSKISHKQFLDPYYWGAYHQNNTSSDTINDLIYNKPLLIVHHRKNTFKVFNREDITDKDSLSAQLYLPVFSYNGKNLHYIKSNYIDIAYKDIIDRMIKEKGEVFKQVYD